MLRKIMVSRRNEVVRWVRESMWKIANLAGGHRKLSEDYELHCLEELVEVDDYSSYRLHQKSALCTRDFMRFRGFISVYGFHSVFRFCLRLFVLVVRASSMVI